MSDRRITPANGRVAARHLSGIIAADQYVDGQPKSVTAMAAFLRATPDGKPDRQVLLGEAVTLFETRNVWGFVQAQKDGYVGWTEVANLRDPITPTHRVAMRHTLAFAQPDMKSAMLFRPPFGARLAVTGTDGIWSMIQIPGQPAAWVRTDHLRPAESVEGDPVAVAKLFLGTPYLWAGNTGDGLDCSGLVQASLLACGIPCPGDSDLIEAAVGDPLPEGATLARGDLIIWKGHVALAMDGERIIHATSAPLEVVVENTAAAIKRIKAAGDGLPTSRKRITRNPA
ncbi:MAG: NLP/P60 hydrolase [Rhodobacteraceae bacterium]|nr:NLP/P60 hydrolase [Paracoccaceae bacterium]